MASPANRPRLLYLDGVRGGSALFVVFHHVWQFVLLQPDVGAVPEWFRVFTVLKFGRYCIGVFIVLSGYCLMLPAIRMVNNGQSRGLKSFASRRARRLLPAYYGALTMSLLVLLVLPQLASIDVTNVMLSPDTFTIGNIIAHVLLLHDLSAKWLYTINPPFWTIAVEIKYYLLYGLILLPLWRRAGPFVVLALAMIGGFAPIFFGGAYAHPWLLGAFVLGMAAATINFYPDSPSLRRLRRLPWNGIALAVWVFLVSIMVIFSRQLDSYRIPLELLVSVGTAAFLAGCTQRLQHGQPLPLLGRLLESRIALFLGEFSYSLYLTHYMLVASLALVVLSLGLPAAVSFFVLAGVAVPACLVFAYGFYLVFERPFIRRPWSTRVAAVRLRPVAGADKDGPGAESVIHLEQST